MPKIERRRTVVDLYQGNYEAELADLQNQAMAAKRAEEDPTARRFASRRTAKTLALAFDNLVAEAEKTAVKVTLWAISHTDYDQLADEHPPRAPIPAITAEEAAKAGMEPRPAQMFTEDTVHGINMKTAPPLMLRLALVPPDEAHGLTLEQKVKKGQEILDEFGDLSQVHYRKLETAAWNVSVGDDALPKYSLVSLMEQGESEPDSEQLDDGD